ncbi:hypothetical protein VKT23_019437 [Stygiomarasmius scandens]|uniref:Fungal-type protein kinase domain-containing protein n=1 Tax=Marasmiellus scandens TaxID=2682957 RepID=A0ABR1IQH1_9AGAR
MPSGTRSNLTQTNLMTADDLYRNTRLTTLEAFEDKFFPSKPDETQLEEILRGLYESTSSSWKNFPKKTGDGEDYYKALQDTMNTIQRAYAKVMDKKVTRIWLDTHLKKPATSNEAANRPGLIQAIGGEKEWEDHKKDLMKSVKTRNRKNLDKFGDSFIYEDEYRRCLHAYWMRTTTPVEVKPDEMSWDKVKAVKAVQQLAGYMHQILREQLDRRFVLGFILFHDSISLWYCDRSGLLGTDRAINIHEEPGRFIHIIGSISTLSYEGLGWDPTMRIWMPQEIKPSYELNFANKDISQSFEDSALHYQTRWEITIAGRKYVTIRALSLSWGEIMCGRATLVWLAVDIEAEKTVVIKQAWSPFTTHRNRKPQDDITVDLEDNDLPLRPEAEVYAHALGVKLEDLNSRLDYTENHIGRVHAHEVVAGTRTAKDLRSDNIQTAYLEIPHERQETKSKSNARKRGRDEMEVVDEPGEEQLHENFSEVIQKAFGMRPLPFTERQLCRIVFVDFGFPLKRFCDLQELLDALEDILKGYEFLLSKGIIQRDLSPNNILICPPLDPSSSERCKGRLNDQDHSKIGFTYTSEDTVQKKLDCEEAQNELDILPGAISALRRFSPCSSEVLELVSAVRGTNLRALTYLDFLHNNIPELARMDKKPSLLDKSHLQFPVSLTTPFPPLSLDRLQDNEERSGTKPYMSYRLLRSSGPPHTAVNDMESMFYVVLYLCLTRNGPGGGLRSELNANSTTGIPDNKNITSDRILHILHCFFDGSPAVLCDNKFRLLEDPPQPSQDSTMPSESFGTYLAPCFHPYFDPLKPLLEDWFQILRRAYAPQLENCSVEYIWPHLYFKEALKRFREKNTEELRKHDETPAYRRLKENEQSRRKKFLESLEVAKNEVLFGGKKDGVVEDNGKLESEPSPPHAPRLSSTACFYNYQPSTPPKHSRRKID